MELGPDGPTRGALGHGHGEGGLAPARGPVACPSCGRCPDRASRPGAGAVVRRTGARA